MACRYSHAIMLDDRSTDSALIVLERRNALELLNVKDRVALQLSNELSTLRRT
jgi:hypothetical protein